MNRTDRLHAILTTLQSKRIVKAEELAQKFDVAIRTIYRDLKALEEGGVPLGAEAGVGYFLSEGYHLPPVMFTQEEARALLLASKVIDKITDQSVSSSFRSALTKVRSVLDPDKKDDIESLESKIMVHPFPDSPQIQAEFSPLEQIKSALSQNLVLEFDYFSNYSGEYSRREVESLGLTYYANQWHLIAYCRKRQDYRDFRIDRISKLVSKSEKYKQFAHPSLEQYIKDLIAQTELIEVQLEVKHETLRYISNTKYQMGLIKEEKLESSSRLTFATFSIEYFSRWVLMMLDTADVIYPDLLNQELRSHSQKISDHHLK